MHDVIIIFEIIIQDFNKIKIKCGIKNQAIVIMPVVYN